MFNPFKKSRVIKFKHKVASQIDCHNWASKMETQRLISSKSFIEIVPRTTPKAVL